MSKLLNEQVLTLTDLKILRFLLNKKEPVKIGEINAYLKKYQQRTKDRIERLTGVFIQESKKPHSKREKPYEIIECERDLVEKMLKKFNSQFNHGIHKETPR